MSKFYNALQRYVFRPAVYTSAGVLTLMNAHGMDNTVKSQSLEPNNPETAQVKTTQFDHWGSIFSIGNYQGEDITNIAIYDIDNDGDRDIIFDYKIKNRICSHLLENVIVDDIPNTYFFDNWDYVNTLKSHNVGIINQIEHDIDNDGDLDVVINYKNDSGAGICIFENRVTE